MHRHPSGIAPLLYVSLVAFAMMAGCSSKEEKPAPPPLGVTVTPVLEKDVPIHQEWVGTMVGNVDAEMAALANVAAVIPDLRRQIVVQEAALNLLLGRNPGPIARGSALAEQFDPPEVPTGLPSQLLERRPDLQQAQENLIAANANVGVAKAYFFPTISLTGAFGGVSPQLSELTGAGVEPRRKFGFTAGRLKNEYRAALAQRDQAKIAFEKSVTQAFGEVSTPLSAHQELAKAYAEQLNSMEAYRESVRLSSIRYDSGLASYLEIIDAQIQMYPAQQSAIVYDLGRKVALVNLYRALGGGWNLNDAQWISTSGTSAPAQSPTP
jgi:multidrug efflux system outer membrane protein